MKAKIKISILIVLLIVIFQRCTVEQKSQKIISQELLYDSIKKYKNYFDVHLTTIIEFENVNATNNNFSNLSIIIDKDTFPLIPVIAKGKYDKENNSLVINFGISKKFVSKTFKNDTLKNKILNSRVVIEKSKIVEKEKSFVLQSLILGYPVKENGVRFE